MNRRVVLHAIDATPAISTQWRDACYFHTVARCVRGRGHASGVADEIAEHARGEQRRSVDDAEGHEQDAKQAGGHVLHNDLVLTKGTKQDLVEGGRRGDGSVHVDPCPEVSVQRVYGSAAALGGQNLRHLRDLRPRNRPTALTLTSTRNWKIEASGL